MVTSSVQSVESTKRRGAAISILSLVTLLWLVAGCEDSNFVLGTIETPSSVWIFKLSTYGNHDSLTRYQLGAVRSSGAIVDITDIGGFMSYPIGDQYPMLDLSGVALSIEQKSHYGLPILAVLEFTFPEAPSGGAEIYWFVEPHLVCSYEIDVPDYLTPSYEAPDLPQIWIDSAVMEDPLGAHDLISRPSMVLIGLNPKFTIPQDHYFEGESSGTVADFHNGRSGTMFAIGGVKARLYLGVEIWLRTFAEGDRIQIGGSSLPATVSVSDRCTLSFGKDSYYTIQPVDSD